MYYLLAGKTAAEAYHNHQAIEYYKRALAFTPLHDVETQFDILIERVELFHRIGNRTAQWKDLQTLETLATQRNEEQSLAKVAVLYAYYYYHGLSDYHAVIQHTERALQWGDVHTSVEIKIDAYILQSSACLRLGKLGEAMQIGTSCLQLTRDSNQRLQEGRVLSTLGLVAIEQNEPALAQDYLTKAVAIARELRNTDLEGKALNNLGMSEGYLQGDFALARDDYEQAFTLIHMRGDRATECICLANLGYTAGMMGDFDGARTYHEQALSISRELGLRYHEIYTLINLSAGSNLQNDIHASLDYAQKALELCRTTGERSGEAWALLYLGHVRLLSKEYEQAVQAFTASIEIRNELGQRNMAIEAEAGLIEIALARNDLSEAVQKVEEILAHLALGGTLEGTEQPLRIYYVCYQALKKNQDPRSNNVLAKAGELLDAQVSKLRDEVSRQKFIQNVPWRLAIQQARQKQTES
jgi:tetratricopeptide (TPR) repeat protein